MDVLGEKERDALRHRVTVTRHVQPEPKVVTPWLVQQMWAGALDMSTLPSALRGQLQAIGRRMQRQAIRAHKREHHAQNHRASALAGGGKREVARRLRQAA